jgi:glycosyltransferase involved in cell wall biosynthesis
MRRILIVAYAFPPAGGAGVQRTAKFVKYLPQYGWLPTVLTVSASCHAVKDTSHVDEFSEDIEVIRTAHFDPVARFTRMSVASPSFNNNGGHGAEKKPLKKALRALARDGWVAFDKKMLIPDQAVTWCPRAIAAGLEAHLDQRFDLIYATGEPYSDYFTAATLSRLTGAPFVIDMRDPWTLSPYRKAVGSNTRQAIERWQERRILSRCRACIFANPAMELYSKAFPEWADKFHYIPNGYDSADFDGVEPQRFDKFTIVHSGTFLPGYRTANTFLLALKELLTASPGLRDKLQVLFVGKIGEEHKLIKELSLEDVVRQTGYLPHRESLSYLKSADLLLLVGGEHAWEETGKVYEYFATGKPVLALVNRGGAAAQLVRNYPLSHIVDRTNIAEARAVLSEMLLTHRSGNEVLDTSFAAPYERKKMTEQLAHIFDDCI